MVVPAPLRKHGWGDVCAALVLAVAAALPGVADEPLVTIAGGVDPDNPQIFRWTVTNRHSSPIVVIEFPHYHADTFMVPTGWSQDCTNLAMVGAPDAPGVCRASVEEAAHGVAPGSSGVFGMRLARVGADPRPGKVTVRFADGTERTVAEVELPTAKSFLERNVMVIGLAAIFAVALLIHFRRRRTKSVGAMTRPT